MRGPAADDLGVDEDVADADRRRWDVPDFWVCHGWISRRSRGDPALTIDKILMAHGAKGPAGIEPHPGSGVRASCAVSASVCACR